MTNAEKIRHMTDRELAVFLARVGADILTAKNVTPADEEINRIWLRERVE